MSARSSADVVRDPPLWRISLVFMIAPGSVLLTLAGLVHLFTFGIAEPSFSAFLVLAMIFYAYPSAFLVGLPVWLWVRRKSWFGDIGYILIGLICALAPLSLLVIFLVVSTLLTGQGLDLVWAVFGLLFVGVPAGVIGAGSGFVFWAILNVGAEPPLARDPDPA
jgi:hypothetical protein